MYAAKWVNNSSYEQIRVSTVCFTKCELQLIDKQANRYIQVSDQIFLLTLTLY